tara:strand:+ start:220 stop:426 length:207 start_codon:yes stop_codon:yes gene_type:complete
MNEENTKGNELMEEWLKMDERRKMAKHHMIKLQQIYDTVNASLHTAKLDYEEYKSRQEMIGHGMGLNK